MKSTILRSGVALACALGLAACGGGDGDQYLQGSLYNVTQEGLVLQNNGGSDLAVKPDANGQFTFFQFPDRVSTDDSFNITVKAIPANAEKCEPVDASGHANYYTIRRISVVCTIKQHGLNVHVRGLTADATGLVIVNGADSKTVTPDNTGDIVVAMSKVNQDAFYGVKVLTQPAGKSCTVTGGDPATNNGSGKVGATDVDNVVVTCS